MDTDFGLDDEQATRWNGPAGCAWVDMQRVLDQLFKPLENLLLEAASVGEGERVLDVGCGTGSTTLAVARLHGRRVHSVGIDVSRPMITVARARAEQEGSSATFIHANAQNHEFEPASFNAIISRFGVMFFANPVRAFVNLRRAVSESGRLNFVAWRSAAENPFMTIAERTAAPLLPNLPARRPQAPGQFAFADPLYTRTILEKSGWAEIDVQSIDVDCTMPENELVTYFSRLGPVGSILHEADERTRARVVETVRAAFEPYVHGAEVCFTAACWMVRARASSA